MKKMHLLQTAILLLIATGFSHAQNGWEKMADMPQATNWYGSCMDPTGEKVYVIGGQGPSEAVNLLANTQIYDFKTNEWLSGTNMLEATSSISAEMIEGKIYTFGEYHSPRKLTEVKEYDPVNDRWSSKGELPVIFFSHGSCVYDGLIYAFGGYDTNFNLRKWLRTYDPGTDSWSELPDMLMADTKPAVCVYNDEIYLFGEKAQKYTPSDSTWTLLNSGINDIVGYAVPIVHEDTILLFGGYKWSEADNYWDPDSSIYAYDPVSDTMVKWGKMPFERFSGGHKYQNYAYLFGGHFDASLGSVTKEVWRFNLGPGVGITNDLVEKISLFPNPTFNLVNIQLNSEGSHLFEITSINGQLIYRERMEGSSHQLDISSFEKGAYFITVRSKNRIITKKIIKL